ncbi:MAG: thermonuclease family protein [Rhodospirillales bacterium]|nr:thermonuclease family protein [Rhodospirillales bacterium]
MNPRYIIPLIVGIALVIGVTLNREDGIVGGARPKTGSRLVIDGRHINLHAIIAPKLGEKCGLPGKEWDCGRLALIGLSRAIDHGRVRCEPQGDNERDQLTAICRIKELDLGAEMLRQGWARAAREAPAQYLALEKAARKAGKGMWR